MLDFDCDPSQASWLRTESRSPERLVTVGPDVFQAYARVLFIPDPGGPHVAEADVPLADDHPSEAELIAGTLQALSPAGGSIQSYYFCLWKGYSDLPVSQFPDIRIAKLRDPYGLAHGTLDDLAQWSISVGLPELRPPAFTWPDDRSWCLTSDVAPHFAVLGGSASAVAMLATSAIPTVPMRYDDEMPRFTA